MSSSPPLSPTSTTTSTATITTTITPTPLISTSFKSTITSIFLGTVGGGIAGLAIARGQMSKAQSLKRTSGYDVRNLVIGWGIKCGVFTATYEGGKALSGFCRENVSTWTQSQKYYVSSSNESPYSNFPAKLMDGCIGGSLAGLLAAANASAFPSPKGSVVLTVPFLVVSGGGLGLIAGGIEGALGLVDSYFGDDDDDDDGVVLEAIVSVEEEKILKLAREREHKLNDPEYLSYLAVETEKLKLELAGLRKNKEIREGEDAAFAAAAGGEGGKK